MPDSQEQLIDVGRTCQIRILVRQRGMMNIGPGSSEGFWPSRIAKDSRERSYLVAFSCARVGREAILDEGVIGLHSTAVCVLKWLRGSSCSSLSASAHAMHARFTETRVSGPGAQRAGKPRRVKCKAGRPSRRTDPADGGLTQQRRRKSPRLFRPGRSHLATSSASMTTADKTIARADSRASRCSRRCRTDQARASYRETVNLSDPSSQLGEPIR